MRISILSSHWDEMQEHVAAESPLEACGFLAGREDTGLAVYRARNLFQSPHRYQVHPQDQIRVFQEIEQRGWDILAVYHSHPAGPPTPSPTDIAEAAYPDFAHLIWSPAPSGWDCHAYRIIYGKIVPIEIEISP